MNFAPGLPDALAQRRPELLAVRDSCGVPLDWTSFCARMGIRVREGTVFHNGRGRCDYASDIVYIDERMHPTLKRAVAAHEIGHLIVNPDRKTILARAIAGGFGNTLTPALRLEEERDADDVAISLLVSPRSILRCAEQSELCLLKLIALVKFKCDVVWATAIRRVLQCVHDDSIVALFGPGRGNDARSAPCVLSAVTRKGSTDVLPFSIGVTLCETTFDDLNANEIFDSYDRSAATFGMALPKPVDGRRVSQLRFLAVFDPASTRTRKAS